MVAAATLNGLGVSTRDAGLRLPISRDVNSKSKDEEDEEEDRRSCLESLDRLDRTYIDSGDMAVDQVPGGRQRSIIQVSAHLHDVGGTLTGGLASGHRPPSLFEHVHPEAPRPGTAAHRAAKRHPNAPVLVPVERTGQGLHAVKAGSRSGF